MDKNYEKYREELLKLISSDKNNNSTYDKFAKKMSKYKNSIDLFLDVLNEELTTDQYEQTMEILKRIPEKVSLLKEKIDELNIFSAQAILSIAKNLNIDISDSLKKFYKKYRTNAELGPVAALFLFDLGDDNGIDTLIDQLSINIDNSLEMAFALKYLFEDNPELEEYFSDSKDPQLKYVYIKYKEALEIVENREESDDKIEFFPIKKINVKDEFYKKFVYELSNEMANTILFLKGEKEIDFISYSGITEFVRLIIPDLINLVKKECKEDGIFHAPDEYDKEKFKNDNFCEKFSELYNKFKNMLFEIYDEPKIYNIDYFTWQLIIILKLKIGFWKKVNFDDELIDNFIIDLAVEIEVKIEEFLSNNDNPISKLALFPDLTDNSFIL